ncbi:carboxylate--amine ligase [Halomicroarcula sp. F28]|uniref:carboxylate--amine ligase n=1 Tax=Haloarcula salinisoli TaxID=2487746 RepID=UPI001C732DC4|nr:carboxylate--amine ligase [Halomicroarcula salinisoli]MBX0288352.1 carboxylate--amine ligase [Halomicroarcula salinisoli]
MSVSSAPREAIVVPGANSGSALECIRSLGSRGIHTIVAAEDPAIALTASRHCGEVVEVPPPRDDYLGYKDALVSLASRPEVRTIIPTREDDIYVLSKYRNEFRQYIATPWPQFDTLETVHDGYRLAEFVSDLDIPVPETQLYDEVADWSQERIIKARYSVLTDDHVDSLEAGRLHPDLGQMHVSPDTGPDRDEVRRRMKGHLPVVQEYIPIRFEYSFRALYDKGEPLATSVRRQTRGMSYAGGTSVYRELVDDPTLEAFGRRILDALDWHGLATVQFIESAETGEYMFGEINPRTWTSIPCDVRAGADYPYFYWLLAGDRADVIDPSYESGYATHLLFGELLYLKSVLFDEYPNASRPAFHTALWSVLSSLYHHPNFDFLTVDDPMPFFQGVRHSIKDALAQ